MKLREHRGCLADSLTTVIEIDPTMDALVAAIKRALMHYVAVSPDLVHVEPCGIDARIGWNTHIVTVDGYGVFGWTDGPLSPTPPSSPSDGA